MFIQTFSQPMTYLPSRPCDITFFATHGNSGNHVSNAITDLSHLAPELFFGF